jgi:cytochrome c-type biogenesis protein CcmH
MRSFIFGLLFIFIDAISFAQENYPFSSPAQSAQFNHLISELRCMVCRHQNLAESDAPLAVDMKQVIYQKVRNGESDQDIQAYLTDRYGDIILFKPPFKGMTWVLWLAPILFILFGFKIFKNTVVGRAQK